MGIGDLAVPKRMRDFGEAFYGRAQSYDRALAPSDDSTLIATLAKNVFARPGEAPPEPPVLPSMCGQRSTSWRRKTALISSPARSLFPVRIL